MKLRVLTLVVLFIAAEALTATPAHAPTGSANQPVATQTASAKPTPVSSAKADELGSLRAELENRKLSLEIAKLKEDVSSWNKNLLIQAGTMLAALFTVLISGWVAAKTVRLQLDAAAAQSDNQKRDHVSGLLKELGSESALVRSAAIQALSEYEEAIPFLVNALRSEQDSDVLSSTIASLSTHPVQALNQLLNLSRQIYAQKLSLASSLVALGVGRQSVAQEFFLRNNDVMSWQESGAGRRGLEAIAVAIKDSGSADGGLSVAKVKETREKMGVAFRAHANCLRAVESLLRSQVFKGKSIALTDAYLSGIQLDGVDMSGWDFSRSNLDRATLRDCICTKSQFERIEGRGISFRGCSMDDASFEGANLVKVDLRDISGLRISFRGAALRDAKVDRARIDDVTFSGAKLVSCDMRNSDLRRANFSCAKLFDTTLDTCRMSGSCFGNTSLIKVELRSLRCRRATFTNTSFDRVLVFKGDFSRSGYVGCQWRYTRVRLPTHLGG